MRLRYFVPALIAGITLSSAISFAQTVKVGVINTYSGPLANENRQRAFYVTERAVFRRNEHGRLELIEIAPGIDLERDVLAHMEFRPDVSSELKLMDRRIFLPQPMGLADIIASKPRPIRSERIGRLWPGESS